MSHQISKYVVHVKYFTFETIFQQNKWSKPFIKFGKLLLENPQITILSKILPYSSHKQANRISKKGEKIIGVLKKHKF